MIGVANPLPPLCVACGIELPDADVNDDGACAECFGESQAKAAAQLEKERGEQLRYLCWEWFTERSPLALERKSASYEDVSYYADDEATLGERMRAAS